MSESRVRENRMHGSMRRREAITASRASACRAVLVASRRPYRPARRTACRFHENRARRCSGVFASEIDLNLTCKRLRNVCASIAEMLVVTRSED